jgi:hypothetical protein
MSFLLIITIPNAISRGINNMNHKMRQKTTNYHIFLSNKTEKLTTSFSLFLEFSYFIHYLRSFEELFRLINEYSICQIIFEERD